MQPTTHSVDVSTCTDRASVWAAIMTTMLKMKKGDDQKLRIEGMDKLEAGNVVHQMVQSLSEEDAPSTTLLSDGGISKWTTDPAAKEGLTRAQRTVITEKQAEGDRELLRERFFRIRELYIQNNFEDKYKPEKVASPEKRKKFVIFSRKKAQITGPIITGPTITDDMVGHFNQFIVPLRKLSHETKYGIKEVAFDSTSFADKNISLAIQNARQALGKYLNAYMDANSISREQLPADLVEIFVQLSEFERVLLKTAPGEDFPSIEDFPSTASTRSTSDLLDLLDRDHDASPHLAVLREVAKGPSGSRPSP